jgi:imidazolonepropionase-like amidohydrolase
MDDWQSTIRNLKSTIRNPDRSWAFVNGRIVLPDSVVEGQALLIEEDRIAGLMEPDSLDAALPIVDVGGRLITPGLIDIHTHGALGHTFNEPAAEAFAAVTAENARQGVTSLLATVLTAPLEDMIRCLCAVSDASSGAGFPEGARYRMGELEYEVHDGVGMLLDRSAFAGSTTLLNTTTTDRAASRVGAWCVSALHARCVAGSQSAKPATRSVSRCAAAAIAATPA